MLARQVFQWFTSNLGHCVSDHKFLDHQEKPHSQCVLKQELLGSGGGEQSEAPQGEAQSLREPGLATRADSVCVRQGQAPFLIQNSNKACA